MRDTVIECGCDHAQWHCGHIMVVAILHRCDVQRLSTDDVTKDLFKWVELDYVDCTCH